MKKETVSDVVDKKETTDENSKMTDGPTGISVGSEKQPEETSKEIPEKTLPEETGKQTKEPDSAPPKPGDDFLDTPKTGSNTDTPNDHGTDPIPSAKETFDLHPDMTAEDISKILTEKGLEDCLNLYGVKSALRILFGIPVLPFLELSEAKQKQHIDKCLFYKEFPGGNAIKNHDYWCNLMYKQGWTRGEELSYEEKTHPWLTDYSLLPQEIQIINNLFAIIADSYWHNK